jgi:hypothetical protein
LYIQALGTGVHTTAAGHELLPLRSARKEFTNFVDNVVGNPRGPARMRRNHAAGAGLLKNSADLPGQRGEQTAAMTG